MIDSTADARRRVLLVLGMHRSGTSALTRVIGLLGARLPETLLPPNEYNESGYWESNILTDLHDELLESAGSSWLDLAPFPSSWYGSELEREFRARVREALSSEFGSADFFVVKDPRIVRFVPFWLAVLAELEIAPAFVIAHRHPIEVAASLEHRDRLNLTHSLLLWLQHVAEAEYRTRGHPRALIGYRDLLADWRGEMRRIGAELGIEWPRPISPDETEADAFLTVKLRHHSSGREDLPESDRGSLFDTVKAAYELLDRGGFAAEDRPEWDGIRRRTRELAESGELPIADTKVVIALQRDVHRMRAELAEQGQEMAAREAELVAVGKRLALREEELRGITVVNDGLRGELIELSNRAARLDESLRSVLASRSWRATRLLRAVMAAARGERPAGRGVAARLRRAGRERAKRIVHRAPRFVREPLLAARRAVRRRKAGPGIAGELEAALPWIIEELGPGDRFEDEASRDFPATDVKLVAFYLPQFHTFPENDEFWGAGFTEWTNTRKAKPEFEGHYQPRTPGELGFYDLRAPEVHARQIELARNHGIHGFCYHHYWFGGRRLMRIPLERHLERPDFDFPFCLHWANEPWTTSWDGLEGSRVLLAQEHSAEDDFAFIRDIEPALRDPRYIRVDGKPLFLLYRPGLFADIRATVDRWQEHCVRAGVGELHLAALQQGFDGLTDPADVGFDAAVEFPPHNITQVDARAAVELFDPEYPGTILSYPDLVSGSLAREAPAYPLYRGLVPAWDCTARRRAATLFVGSTPDLYREWLEGLCRYTRDHLPPEQQFIFINAWNEWAEGAYLEPDDKYGYAYLNRTGEALCRVAATAPAPAPARKIVVLGHDAARLGAQNLLLHIVRWLARRTATELRIVLGAGGEMVPDYRRVAPVLVLEELRAAASSPAEAERAIADFTGDDVDLIFVNSAASGRYLPLIRFLGAPVVSYIHELEESLKKFCTPESVAGLLAASSKVVSSSRAVERNLVGGHGVTAEQSETVYTFIEHGGIAADAERRRELRLELGLKPATVAVFGCGTRDWRKGPDLFVDVAARLEASGVGDFRFFWIGPPMPGEYEDLERGLAGRGLDSRVTFLGALPNCEYFAAGDIFVLSSREDPSPLVCLLAAECRLPTVCFADAGGAPDFVGDGGVVVPYEDVAAMAAAVAELIADRRRREALGRAAEENLLAGYTTEATMPELFHIMRTAAGSPPAVSVVVPSYNYARYLDRRMASILDQTFQDLEVIVEDDGSTDGTLEKLERWGRRRNVRVVTHEQNSGAFTMWLEGMRAAQSEILWIAEADDDCQPELLATLIPFFRDPRVKLAYAQSNVVDEDDRHLGDYSLCFPEFSRTKWLSSYVVPAEQELEDGLAVKNTIVNASAVLFRKPDLAVMDTILRDFKLSGDWYLYLNVIAGGHVAYSPKKLNVHRRHQKSIIARYGDKGVALAELGRVHNFVLSRYERADSLIEKMVGYAFEIWSNEDLGSAPEDFWAHYGLDLPAARRAALEVAVFGRVAV